MYKVQNTHVFCFQTITVYNNKCTHRKQTKHLDFKDFFVPFIDLVFFKLDNLSYTMFVKSYGIYRF